jgi:hypothetical protein
MGVGKNPGGLEAKRSLSEMEKITNKNVKRGRFEYYIYSYTKTACFKIY